MKNQHLEALFYYFTIRNTENKIILYHEAFFFAQFCSVNNVFVFPTELFGNKALLNLLKLNSFKL